MLKTFLRVVFRSLRRLYAGIWPVRPTATTGEGAIDSRSGDSGPAKSRPL